MDKCDIRSQERNWKGYLRLNRFQKHFRQLASHCERPPSTWERDPSVSVQTPAQLEELCDLEPFTVPL